MPRVLVVDDDPTVRRVVAEYLASADIEMAEAETGPQALTMAANWHPDLVVLDLSLPGLDGLEVFRRLRAGSGKAAVIMLTARGEEPDRILGFEVGADDYVAKPFSPRELLLRIQSVLRRSSALHWADQPLVDGALALDPVSRIATLEGQALNLTAREFDLLAHFLAHPGTVFTREELVRQVWGWQYGDQTTVTVHVRRLREKVERDPSAPVRLSTVWGVGYRWDLQGEYEQVTNG